MFAVKTGHCAYSKFLRRIAYELLAKELHTIFCEFRFLILNFHAVIKILETKEFPGDFVPCSKSSFEFFPFSMFVFYRKLYLIKTRIPGVSIPV